MSSSPIPHNNPSPAAPHPVSGVVGEQYPRAGVWVVTVRGELDHFTCPALRQTLETAAAAHPVVVLDMEEVTFGDSTFLNMVLRIHHQTDLRIAGAPQQVLNLLEMTGTDQVLHLYPDLTAAAPV